MDIGVIEKPTVRKLLVEKIADMIIRGELLPGDKLPTERELAAQAKVSKSAVHLALTELERMGFIETNERHGTYVADFARKGNIETLNMLIRFSGEHFDQKRIEDMLEMRMALEGKAMELMAEHEDTDFSSLGAIVEEAQAYIRSERVLPGRLASIFFAFHHQVCVCSGNFILPLLFNSFEYVTLNFWERAVRKFGPETCTELLCGMFETLQKNDAEESKAFLQKEFDLFLTSVE